MTAPARPSEPLALRLPLRGSRLIEASAGTGKTFTISGLYLRLVLGHGDADRGFGRALLPPQILVMTFTEAATQELRDRIRTRLGLAARHFRGEIDPPDAVIARLRADYPPERRPECAARLDTAAQWMDEAAVSTIHGWCQRMLREHAFDSGSLFTQTVETDQSALLATVARDYWRRHCYDLAGDALDWVDSHWQTPDQLLARLMPLLRHAPADPAAAQDSLGEVLHAARTGLRQALARLKAPWREWVPQLRAALDDACARKLIDGRKLKPSYYLPWLDTLAAWAGDEAIERPELGAAARQRLTPQGMAEAWKQGEPLRHPALDALPALYAELDALPQPGPAALAHAAAWVAQRFEQEKQRRAELGFDDMLTRLDAALHGPNGGRLAALIRAQFPVALVDEFQDTDPVQYRILDAIYDIGANRDDCGLLMIGDPKQAIYAFRGADIYTYLAARRAAGPRRDTLDTNHRSSREMVAAVNRVFEWGERQPGGEGAFLFRRGGDDPVPFAPVQAAGRPERFVADGGPAPALTFWQLPQDKPLAAGAYTAQAAAGCASRIVALLRQAAAGRAGFEAPDDALRPLRPADIAILVRTGDEARAIRAELARRGVRSVYLSDQESVFDSAEAADLLLWLKACAEPDDDRALRAALASRTLALELAELERIQTDERLWESRVLQFRAYREGWRRNGVLAMLRRLLNDFDLPRRMLARDDGERRLTNLLHLAELMQRAAAELDGEQALVRHLAGHVWGTARPAAAEDQIVRLESDEQLLKVVTIHKSKGLEYPLVFLPFICAFRPERKDRPPLRYHNDDGRPVVDVAPDDAAEARADRERLAENLRMLYVALTRARHACWAGVADLCLGQRRDSAFHRSALGYLLGGGRPLPSTPALGQWLADLCDSAPELRAEPLPAADDARLPPPAQAVAAQRLRVARRSP
ncbi:exodeoxyribonuclease V subunit beta, partial [Pigmentiphaga soli]|uniref:exodeoxyribonuclease V subunit beta n=1 Tax=Pigmentiphaga soli TaxID=1007095 RepID=UPI0031E878B3